MSMYATPDRYALERMRLYALLQFKTRERERKLCAARRALSICNRLKPGAFKKKHNARILRALNQLRVSI